MLFVRVLRSKVVSLTVRARAVVVSGGAIHTPAILLRSGLKHPLIGCHLHLHPVLVAGGVFPEDYRDGTMDPPSESGTGATVDLVAAAAAKQASQHYRWGATVCSVLPDAIITDTWRVRGRNWRTRPRLRLSAPPNSSRLFTSFGAASSFSIKIPQDYGHG